ncbi:hypothetical protein [Streptomyces sp. NPDC052721]|uniref:hypothetical protein n=1 Tax=Streptomyces sp. NPDC052721 TaxID=3154955 RepID=UPI00342634AF
MGLTYVGVDHIAQDLAIVGGQVAAEEVCGQPVRLGQLLVPGREALKAADAALTHLPAPSPPAPATPTPPATNAPWAT